MSVHGSIRRRLELCTIEWKRNIPEQGPTSTLTPGWHMTITLPFVDVNLAGGLSKLSWKDRLTRRPTGWADRTGFDLWYAGYGIGASVDNGNEPELFQDGDCTVLEQGA